MMRRIQLLQQWFTRTGLLMEEVLLDPLCFRRLARLYMLEKLRIVKQMLERTNHMLTGRGVMLRQRTIPNATIRSSITSVLPSSRPEA